MADNKDKAMQQQTTISNGGAQRRQQDPARHSYRAPSSACPLPYPNPNPNPSPHFFSSTPSTASPPAAAPLIRKASEPHSSLGTTIASIPSHLPLTSSHKKQSLKFVLKVPPQSPHSPHLSSPRSPYSYPPHQRRARHDSCTSPSPSSPSLSPSHSSSPNLAALPPFLQTETQHRENLSKELHRQRCSRQSQRTSFRHKDHFSSDAEQISLKRIDQSHIESQTGLAKSEGKRNPCWEHVGIKDLTGPSNSCSKLDASEDLTHAIQYRISEEPSAPYANQDNHISERCTDSSRIRRTNDAKPFEKKDLSNLSHSRHADKANQTYLRQTHAGQETKHGRWGAGAPSDQVLVDRARPSELDLCHRFSGPTNDVGLLSSSRPLDVQQQGQGATLERPRRRLQQEYEQNAISCPKRVRSSCQSQQEQDNPEFGSLEAASQPSSRSPQVSSRQLSVKKLTQNSVQGPHGLHQNRGMSACHTPSSLGCPSTPASVQSSAPSLSPSAISDETQKPSKKRRLQSLLDPDPESADGQHASFGGDGRQAVSVASEHLTPSMPAPIDGAVTSSSVEIGIQKECGAENSSKLFCQDSQLIPAKRLLGNILDRLQKKDKFGVFAEPVDPKEVPNYYDIIKHPMDFRTMRSRITSGYYVSIELFKRDVFLICDNAMQYNGKGTVYFRHARAIKDASERIFEDFKVSGIVLEMDEINIRSKNGGNGRSCEKQDPSLNTGSPSDVRLEDESSGYVFNGKRFQAIDENRRSTYNPTCALVQGNDSLLTTIIGESSHVIPMGYQMEFLYAKSLARFAADLGPLVWKVAAEKIKKALPPGCPFGPGWVGEKEAIGVTSALLNKQRLGVQPIKQFEKLSSESKVAGTSDTQVHPMTQSNPDDGSRNREEDGSVASALSSKQCLAVQLTQQSEKLSTEKEVTGVLNVKGIPVSQSKFNDRSQIREGDVLLNTGVYLMVQSKPARSDQQIHPVMQSKLENTNCSMEKDMDTLDVGVIPATQSEQGSKEETCRVSKLLDCEAGVCGVAELPIEARSSVAFGNSLIQNANLEKLDQEAPAKFGAHAELISRFHGLDNSSRSHGHSSLQCGDTKLPVKNDQSSKVVNSMLKLAEQVNLNNPVSLQPEEEATLESGISKHIDRDVHVNTQLPVFRTTNAINVINDKGFHMEESGHLRRSFDSRIAQPDTGVNQLRTELGKMLMNNPLNSKVGQLKVNLGELPTSDIASSFRPPQSVKGANQVTKIGEIRSNTATRDHFDGQNSAYHSNWQSRLNGIQSAEPGTVQTSNSINDNIYQPKNFQNPRGLGFPHNLNLPEQHELDASDVVINNTGSIPSDQTKSASSLSHSAQGFNLLRNAGLKTGESGVENQDGGGPLHPILSASSVSHAAQELGMQNNAITTQHTSINSQHSSSNRVSSCNVNLAEVGLSALPSPLFLESSIRERVKETCNYRQNELVNLPTRMATGDVTSIMQKGFTSDIDFLMQPMEPRNGQLIDRDLANIAVQNVGQLSKKQFTSQGLPLANFPSGLSSMNNMPVVQDVPGWVQVQAEPMHISGKGSKDKFHHEVLDKPFNFSETSSNSAIRIPLHASRCQDPQVYDYGDKKQGLNMPHFLQSHQYGDSIQSPSGQCHQRQQLHTQSPRPLAQQNVWSTPLLLNAQTSGPPAAEGLNFSRQYQSPNQSMLSQGGVLPWQYLPQQMQHQGSRQCPAGPDLNVSLPPSKSSYDQSNSNEIQQPDLALQL